MKKILSRAFLLIICMGVIYAVSFGLQKPRSMPVGVGDTAPDFTLQDHQGHKATLSASRGKSPVVLVFYRGYW